MAASRSDAVNPPGPWLISDGAARSRQGAVPAACGRVAVGTPGIAEVIDLSDFVGRIVEVVCLTSVFWTLQTQTDSPDPAPARTATSGEGQMHPRPAGQPDEFVIHPKRPFLHVDVDAAADVHWCIR